MSFEMASLGIKGYQARNTPNVFLRQKKASGPVAVVFPGLAYNIDMPLLYYSIGCLLETGYSVIAVNTRYDTQEEFLSSSGEKRREWLQDDAEGVLDAINHLEEHSLSVLVGKSLGTIQMAHLTKSYQVPRLCKAVWLTPLLRNEQVLDQMVEHEGKSLVVIGTDDQQYDDGSLAEISGNGRSTILTVLEGNHSLDVPSGVLDSMKELAVVIQSIRKFVE
jgi:hypothetical protein